MFHILISLSLVLGAAFPALAQDISAAEVQIERLRAQLRDVADKEAQLQERSRQLDEDLTPENVERSVAGVGTTDARALRDQRRQQLERQKAAVEGQLTELAASRARLEAAVATAEAEAARLRAAALGASNATAPAEAAPTPSTPATTIPAAKKANVPAKKSRPRKRNRPRRRA